MELAYLWPSFTNGFSPPYPGAAGPGARLMSLRPGNQSRPITAATFGAEHQCSFWDKHPVS